MATAQPRLTSLVFATTVILCLLSSVSSTVYYGDDLTNGLNGTTFDYIVVGCGIAGLVLSARLTEDADTTVLCLEAGQLDHYETLIQYPVYTGEQPPLFYEWGMSTVPQTQLDGATRSVPMGKGVGGGSLINGMIWNRGSQSDFDSWAELNDDEGWSWGSIVPFFRKSETFTPKWYTDLSASGTGIFDSFNSSVHGYGGPVQVSYPNYLWPQSYLWFEALQELGVPKCVDPNDGSSAGGYFIPLDIDATNQTRSDARRAYYDPVCERPNYNLVVNAQVTRILFSTDNPEPTYSNCTGPARLTKRQSSSILEATGVEFTCDPGAPPQKVFASRSVILSAGAIHTSALLEVSGIGNPSILTPLNITTLIDLPGVGANLQDHAMIHLDYHYRNTTLHTPAASLLTNTTFNTLAEQQYLTSKTGPWTAKPSTAVAFPSLQQIMNSTSIDYMLDLASYVNSTPYLPQLTQQSPQLLTGYLSQLDHTLHALSSSSIPSHEILNDNSGALDLSLMRPLSRGETHITSSDPFSPAAINPNWLSHPLDFAIMEHALLFNQRLLDTPQLSSLLPTFSAEGVPYNPTPSQIETLLKQGIGTEYHYSGTAAMLPREMGGVVDSRLTVYGTSNLRVVDSSVFPVIPGGHLMAVVYGVAERAAVLVREDEDEVGGVA